MAYAISPNLLSQSRFGGLAGSLAAALTLVSVGGCGAEPEIPPQPSDLSSTDVFTQCEAQEKVGDACSCWQMFKQKYTSAPPGETAAVNMQLQTCADRKKRHDEILAQAPTRPVFPPRTAEDESCYVRLNQTGAASEILADLVNKCGAPTGMVKMTTVIAGTQRAEEKPETYRLQLNADECYRFFAVGDAGIMNLIATIRSPDDELLLVDADRDRIKVLGPRRAFCPKTSGLYKIRISVEAGGGHYLLQGFRRPASSQPPSSEDPKHAASLDRSP